MQVRGAQGPIQRAFTGLLGLFDLKGSEVAPNSMAGFVQPIIDTQPFLTAATMRSLESSGTTAFASASFIGGTTILRVPPRKVWVVTAASAFLQVPVGAPNPTVSINTRFGGGAVFSSPYILGQSPPAPTPGIIGLLGAGFVGNLVLPEGWEFGVGVSGLEGSLGPWVFSYKVLCSEFFA